MVSVVVILTTRKCLFKRGVPCSVILSVAQLQKPKEYLAKKNCLQVISRFQRSSKKKKLFSFTPCCLGAYWTCGGLLSTYQLPAPLISLKFLRSLSKLGFNHWLEGSYLQMDQLLRSLGLVMERSAETFLRFLSLQKCRKNNGQAWWCFQHFCRFLIL